jgi:hypothetical protein
MGEGSIRGGSEPPSQSGDTDSETVVVVCTDSGAENGEHGHKSKCTKDVLDIMTTIGSTFVGVLIR